MLVKHAKVVAIPDDGTSEVGSNEWNASHVDENGNALSVREKLSADRTYYIRTDGSDSNNGLTNNAGGAFLTFVHAYAVICGDIDFGGHTVTISMQNTTWTATCAFNSGWVGGGAVILDVNGGTINPTAANCIDVTAPLPGSLTYQNVTLQTTTSGYGVNLVAPCAVFAGSGITYGASDLHVYAEFNAKWVNTASYAITGGATFCHLNSLGAGCSMNMGYGHTITITGTPNFPLGFIFAQSASYIDAGINTISGSTTGPRYLADLNGCIQDWGQGPTYLPGNSAGELSGGSVYGTNVFTVAGLPAATGTVNDTSGMRVFVTDSNATLAAGLGNVVAAGAGNRVPVYTDGTNWRIG